MLRLRLVCQFAAAAAALCAAQSAISQSSGLGTRLDAAEKKLDEDMKACRAIDPKEYESLLDEANQNQKRAWAAEDMGVPINVDQVVSDLKRATGLAARATAAAAKPCPPPQQKPQQAAPPGQKIEIPPTTKPIAGGQLGLIPRDPFWDFADDADDAMDDLDTAMRKCDMDAIKKLIPQLEEMAKRAREFANAAKAAGKFSRIDPKDAEELAGDLNEAIFWAKVFKCPAKPKQPEQPQSAPKPEGEKPKPKPAEPEKPKPPEHSIIEDLFPKTPLPPPPNGKTSFEMSPFAARILDIHNAERAAFHVPPLKWNYQLELDATNYAQTISRLHILEHAPREGRGIERENLLQALPGWSVGRMMQSWTMEKRDFTPGYYPNVARDGNWLNVSHYTQMIWPTTTDIGCGYATGGGYGWLVCRYSPGGNKDGKPVGLPYMPERG